MDLTTEEFVAKYLMSVTREGVEIDETTDSTL